MLPLFCHQASKIDDNRIFSYQNRLWTPLSEGFQGPPLTLIFCLPWGDLGSRLPASRMPATFSTPFSRVPPMAFKARHSLAGFPPWNTDSLTVSFGPAVATLQGSRVLKPLKPLKLRNLTWTAANHPTLYCAPYPEVNTTSWTVGFMVDKYVVKWVH